LTATAVTGIREIAFVIAGDEEVGGAVGLDMDQLAVKHDCR
jgi:hypothetical protein